MKISCVEQWFRWRPTHFFSKPNARQWANIKKSSVKSEKKKHMILNFTDLDSRHKQRFLTCPTWSQTILFQAIWPFCVGKHYQRYQLKFYQPKLNFLNCTLLDAWWIAFAERLNRSPSKWSLDVKWTNKLKLNVFHSQKKNKCVTLFWWRTATIPF